MDRKNNKKAKSATAGKVLINLAHFVPKDNEKEKEFVERFRLVVAVTLSSSTERKKKLQPSVTLMLDKVVEIKLLKVQFVPLLTLSSLFLSFFILSFSTIHRFSFLFFSFFSFLFFFYSAFAGEKSEYALGRDRAFARSGT